MFLVHTVCVVRGHGQTRKRECNLLSRASIRTLLLHKERMTATDDFTYKTVKLLGPAGNVPMTHTKWLPSNDYVNHSSVVKYMY